MGMKLRGMKFRLINFKDRPPLIFTLSYLLLSYSLAFGAGSELIPDNAQKHYDALMNAGEAESKNGNYLDAAHHYKEAGAHADKVQQIHKDIPHLSGYWLQAKGRATARRNESLATSKENSVRRKTSSKN